MPFKAKAACRRHIPRQQHRVTNWAEYDAALRARGSLTVWFTPEAIAAWAAPRTTRGGQLTYSDLAITTEPPHDWGYGSKRVLSGSLIGEAETTWPGS